MPVVTGDRVRREIVALSHRGLCVRDFSLAVTRTLRRAVPFDGACVATMDPATLLMTGHVVENALPAAAMPRYSQIEVRESDFNKFTALARAPQCAASLSAATDGDLDRSLRHRDLRRPNGFDGDELRVALTSDSVTWGGIVLHRESGSDFTHAEASMLAALSTPLAEGLRRAILLTTPRPGPQQEPEPGLLVLAADNSIELANAAADEWLAELSSDDRFAPLVIEEVAHRARSVAAGDDHAPARARTLTPSGRWLLVRGSVLGEGRAAVTLEAPSAPELAPLIADAYCLTERERAVTQLVARGLSTGDIATRLFLSPYTVQDHLKSIFEKTGVSTRGELVARLFFDHYAPCLSDHGAVGESESVGVLE